MTRYRMLSFPNTSLDKLGIMETWFTTFVCPDCYARNSNVLTLLNCLILIVGNVTSNGAGMCTNYCIVTLEERGVKQRN